MTQNPPVPAPPGVTDAGRPLLTRDKVQLLVHLATAVSRARSYPAGHPLLRGAVDVLSRQLKQVGGSRASVVIGVASDRLLLDGSASDPGHPVLRELAARLHRHQLASVTLGTGIGLDELGDLLAALGSESWRQGKPLALEPAVDHDLRWPSVRLEPLPLDQLSLADPADLAAGSDRARLLWEGLIRTVLSGDGSGSGAAGAGAGGNSAGQAADSSPAALAEAVRVRSTDRDFCRAVVDWFAQLGEQLPAGEQAPDAHRQVADLFAALDRDSLDRLLELGASPARRRELVARSAQSLPISAVLELLRAAAGTSGQPLSGALLGMLTKVAGQARGAGGGGAPGEADGVVRDSIRQIVGSWSDDAEMAPYRQLLDLLSDPAGTEGAETGRAGASALRLIHLGLEIDSRADPVVRAARAAADAVPLSEYLDLVDRAERAARDISHLLLPLRDPSLVRQRLLDDAIPFDLLARLLDRLGEAAVDPLLEALEASESAARRRALLQRLERFGSQLGPILLDRLPGKPWFVQRNLLALMATLPELPAGFDPSVYARDDHPKVRREAYKLLLSRPGDRSAAILAAMEDADTGIVMMGLGAAAEHPPADLVRRLLTILGARSLEPEVRAAGIRLLGTRSTTIGREWLLAQVVATKGWFWFKRTILKPKSADQLAALGALARGFSRHPTVAAALRLASASDDPEVRAAAGVGDR